MSDNEKERDEAEVEGHSYDRADSKGEEQTYDAFDAKSDDDAVEGHLFERAAEGDDTVETRLVE